MSNAKSPYAYPEVRAVMDAALDAGGAIFTPRDNSGAASEAAVHTFVARANNIRNNLRKIGESAPYERLIIRKDGVNVVLELKPAVLPGDLRTLDGVPLTIAAPASVISDEDRALLEELERTLRDE